MIYLQNSFWESWLQKWFTRLFWAAIVVNAGAMWVTILEPDGALYATIAKTIAQSGDFIHLRVEGKDWLDKPHFPFWMAALSFRVFGVNGFAYKLPALLFWAGGAWYTYRMAAVIYGRTVAQLATLIYVSAAHLVISNNDVRAEPYLTALTIAAVYHFFLASGRRAGSENRSGSGVEGKPSRRMALDLLLGSVFAACAMMTKGPFVLITIFAGLGLDWILTKDWVQFRRLRWWVALVLIGIFTIPELYSLYVQFDRHPELEVFERKGVSGIRFFFWDSQFGRFFNTGPIRGNGDPFFYFHTLLWAFLPWSVLLYAAFGRKLGDLWRGLREKLQVVEGGSAGEQSRERVGFIPGEWICAGSALVSFVIFSLSRFQLPHYLNILFPFFAIVTARWLYNVRRISTVRIVGIIQGALNWLLVLMLLFLCWWTRFEGWVLVAAAIVLVTLVVMYLLRGRELWYVFGRSLGIALVVYAFVNFYLYPGMLHFQAGTEAGRYVRKEEKGGAILLKEAPANYSFEFYCPGAVPRIPIDSIPARLPLGPVLIFIPDAYRDTLQRKGFPTTLIRRFPNFHVSQLTGDFLNWRTRDSAVAGFSLVEVRNSK